MGPPMDPEIGTGDDEDVEYLLQCGDLLRFSRLLTCQTYLQNLYRLEAITT
jgi:hypothetical protein